MGTREIWFTWLLAILVGHLLDLLTIKFKLFTLKQKALPPKMLYIKGQYVEAKDEWSNYYPKTNMRWLASLNYWIIIMGVIAGVYFLIKYVIF